MIDLLKRQKKEEEENQIENLNLNYNQTLVQTKNNCNREHIFRQNSLSLPTYIDTNMDLNASV